MKTTAERLKEIMEEKALKQSDIIERAKPFMEQFKSKLTRQDLSQYCSGKVRPSQNKLFLLAAACGVNEAWLMGYDVPKSRNKEMLDLISAEKHPAILAAIRSNSSLAEDLIEMMTKPSKEELQIINAYREADERTRRMILYMLKIGDLNDADS